MFSHNLERNQLSHDYGQKKLGETSILQIPQWVNSNFKLRIDTHENVLSGFRNMYYDRVLI